jgi:hypothetical protein
MAAYRGAGGELAEVAPACAWFVDALLSRNS